jgi:hypothetical protein
MEHIWDEVWEEWFANEVFAGLDGVENRLEESLVYLEQNKISSLRASCKSVFPPRFHQSIPRESGGTGFPACADKGLKGKSS